MSSTFKMINTILLLLLLGFIWGSGYSLAKLAITNGVSPLGYSFWQALGPAVLLTLACFFSKKNSLIRPRYWFYFTLCGLIGIVIPNTNMYFLVTHISPGLLAVLVNTVPLIVYPLALLWGQEKADLGRFLAVILGMGGIVLILRIPTAGFYSKWTLFALISPLSFALCSLYINAQKTSLIALEAASGMLIAATVLLFPLVLQQHAFYSLSPPFNLPKSIILLEMILSSAGYLLFFVLVRYAGPVFYSLTGGIVALTGLFWGALVFHEMPSFTQSIAILFIVLAIALLSWRQQKLNKELIHAQ